MQGNGQSHLTVVTCKMLNGNVQFVLKVHHKLPNHTIFPYYYVSVQSL